MEMTMIPLMDVNRAPCHTPHYDTLHHHAKSEHSLRPARIGKTNRALTPAANRRRCRVECISAPPWVRGERGATGGERGSAQEMRRGLHPAVAGVLGVTGLLTGAIWAVHAVGTVAATVGVFGGHFLGDVTSKVGRAQVPDQRILSRFLQKVVNGVRRQGADGACVEALAALQAYAARAHARDHGFILKSAFRWIAGHAPTPALKERLGVLTAVLDHMPEPHVLDFLKGGHCHVADGGAFYRRVAGTEGSYPRPSSHYGHHKGGPDHLGLTIVLDYIVIHILAGVVSSGAGQVSWVQLESSPMPPLRNMVKHDHGLRHNLAGLYSHATDWVAHRCTKLQFGPLGTSSFTEKGPSPMVIRLEDLPLEDPPAVDDRCASAFAENESSPRVTRLEDVPPEDDYRTSAFAESEPSPQVTRLEDIPPEDGHRLSAFTEKGGPSLQTIRLEDRLLENNRPEADNLSTSPERFTVAPPPFARPGAHSPLPDEGVGPASDLESAPRHRLLFHCCSSAALDRAGVPWGEGDGSGLTPYSDGFDDHLVPPQILVMPSVIPGERHGGGDGGGPGIDSG